MLERDRRQTACKQMLRFAVLKSGENPRGARPLTAGEWGGTTKKSLSLAAPFPPPSLSEMHLIYLNLSILWSESPNQQQNMPYLYQCGLGRTPSTFS